jgi:hypothetical protein
MRGTKAFSGLYYDRDQTNPLEYKLVTRKTAIVPAVSIVYICSEMNEQIFFYNDVILKKN